MRLTCILLSPHFHDDPEGGDDLGEQFDRTVVQQSAGMRSDNLHDLKVHSDLIERVGYQLELLVSLNSGLCWWYSSAADSRRDDDGKHTLIINPIAANITLLGGKTCHRTRQRDASSATVNHSPSSSEYHR